MWLLIDSHQIKLGGRLCVPGLAHPTCNCLCIPLWLRCLVLCQTRASGGGGEQNIPSEGLIINSPALQAGLVCLCSVLCLVYLLWLLLTARYHCQVSFCWKDTAFVCWNHSWYSIQPLQVWFKWRNENQEIRLLGFSSGPKKRVKDKRESSAAGMVLATADDDTGRERVAVLEESSAGLVEVHLPPSSTEDQSCTHLSQRGKGCQPPRSGGSSSNNQYLLKPPPPPRLSSQPQPNPRLPLSCW